MRITNTAKARRRRIGSKRAERRTPNSAPRLEAAMKAAVSASGMRNLRDAYSMRAATWSVRNHLALARSLAIARREKIKRKLQLADASELLQHAIQWVQWQRL